MTDFAKYVDEDTIIRPRKNYKSNTLVAFNFDKNEPLLRQEGFKPLVDNEVTSEPSEGYMLQPSYEEFDDYIQVHYTEVEIQNED